MSEIKSNRFSKYFPLLLDALRSKHPEPMRPAEARAWIRANVEVPAGDLTRFIQNGKQSIFENDVHWARFYLAKAKLIRSPKRGLGGLTVEGIDAHLTAEDTWELYVRVRDASRPGAAIDEETVAAPDTVGEDDGEAFWFAGATDEQMRRFLAEGIWQVENERDSVSVGLVSQISIGDRIAAKASFVQKRGLPFDVGGKPVSVMRIKAIGTVLEPLDNGKGVRVAWDPGLNPRDWYFYTYVQTLVIVGRDNDGAARLIDFAFHGSPQDYAWFLAQPYWVAKYGNAVGTAGVVTEANRYEDVDIAEVDDEPKYTIDDIVKDGSFLSTGELESILTRLRAKKNLVLQGPPGTGKTWLAKRLGFALVGSDDRETTRSRLRVVQFHPSLAYEDLCVGGARPAKAGFLSLTGSSCKRSMPPEASQICLLCWLSKKSTAATLRRYLVSY